MKLIAVILLCIAAILLWTSINKQRNTSAEDRNALREKEKQQLGNTKNAKNIANTTETQPHTPPQDSASDVATPLQTPQILEAINDFATTYDPKELVKIEPYLLHADPQVRNAAIDGMIRLGDASASVMLRSASAKAPTTADAIAMLQAAEYLQLPPVRGIIKKKK